MTTTSVLKDVLRRRPFEPFRITMSSGETYEVRHPEMALLVRSGIYVASGGDEDLPARAAYLPLLHIAGVEAASPSEDNGGESE